MIFGTIIRKLHALEHTSVRLWASKARFLIADHVSGSGRTPKRHAREVEILKRIIGEYAVANGALKKTSGGGRG